jgi:hypothetical protein
VELRVVKIHCAEEDAVTLRTLGVNQLRAADVAHGLAHAHSENSRLAEAAISQQFIGLHE